MLVSTKGRYALRVMLELAQSQPDAYMPLPLIAQRQGISEKYLESIIAIPVSYTHLDVYKRQVTSVSVTKGTAVESGTLLCTIG